MAKSINRRSRPPRTPAVAAIIVPVFDLLVLLVVIGDPLAEEDVGDEVEVSNGVLMADVVDIFTAVDEVGINVESGKCSAATPAASRGLNISCGKYSVMLIFYSTWLIRSYTYGYILISPNRNGNIRRYV